MAAAQPNNPAPSVDAVRVTNPHGSAGYVVVCDHASNFLPPEFHALGLPADELTRHIAWDPGARAVATSMAQTLDAPVVESAISRLIADCNRPLDAPDLIPTISETTEIPGNAGLDEQSRANRIALAHQPFHEAIDALIEDRLAAGQACAMIAIH
jgi:predicted N-formylglutamate amidohydrolase